MATAEIHGVYKLRAPQPCYIVELTIRDSESALQLSQILFDSVVPGHGVRIQAPFEEHFLSADGETVLGGFKYGWDNPDVWIGNVRLAFLMHFLEPGKSLRTPFGDLAIPEISKRPQRLKQLKYVSPY